MKIYLAGSCSSEDRTMMRQIANKLRDETSGNVYCPFDLQIPDAWNMSQEDWAQKVFEADIKAIDEADLVILISPGRESTAGTNWEQGYAYATGKTVYVFQITDKPTSLMTYCGCNLFFSVGQDRDLKACIEHALYGRSLVKEPCYTVLT